MVGYAWMKSIDSIFRSGATLTHPTRATVPWLTPLDFLDLIGLGAAGRDNFDIRALGLADERTRERRRDRDLALLGVGLGLTDDLPHSFLVSVLVDQRHSRAELDGVAGKLRY